MTVEYYKHDIPTWMEGTADLSDGAYRVYHVIIQLIYQHEGPIKRHDRGLAGLCNQSIRSLKKHLTELIETGKISELSGRLDNERSARLLRNLNEIRSNARESGSKGGYNSGLARRNPLKNNEPTEAKPSTTPKQTRSIREKRRVEESLSAARAREYPPPDLNPKPTTDDSGPKMQAIEQACHDALPAECSWTVRQNLNYTSIIEAINAGATLDDIRAGIKATSDKLKRKPNARIGSWAYFTAAILEVMQSRRALCGVRLDANGSAELEAAARSRWEAVMSEWVRQGKRRTIWDEVAHGPPPGTPTCKVPPDILRAHGIETKPQTAEA